MIFEICVLGYCLEHSSGDIYVTLEKQMLKEGFMGKDQVETWHVASIVATLHGSFVAHVSHAVLHVLCTINQFSFILIFPNS